MGKFTDEIAQRHFLIGQAAGSPVVGARCTCGLDMSSNGAYAIHLGEVVGDSVLLKVAEGLLNSAGYVPRGSEDLPPTEPVQVLVNLLELLREKE